VLDSSCGLQIRQPAGSKCRTANQRQWRYRESLLQQQRAAPTPPDASYRWARRQHRASLWHLQSRCHPLGVSCGRTGGNLSSCPKHKCMCYSRSRQQVALTGSSSRSTTWMTALQATRSACATFAAGEPASWLWNVTCVHGQSNGLDIGMVAVRMAAATRGAMSAPCILKPCKGPFTAGM
jgi:hypothetical protein